MNQRAEGWLGFDPVTETGNQNRQTNTNDKNFHDGDDEYLEFIKLQTYTRVHGFDESEDIVMVIGQDHSNLFVVDQSTVVDYFNLDGTGYDGSYLVQEDKDIPEFTYVQLEDIGTANIKPFTVVKLRNGELALVTSVEDAVYEMQGVMLSDQTHIAINWCNGSQFYSIESPNDIVGVYLNRDNLN